jgi:F0F1-type ATP synthase assembly protein I
MTGPEEGHSSTRPISVAELLAKNGTIGAPPVGGRRRRRRGNSDAVTVAELTGEIPIVSDEGADEDTEQTAAIVDEDHDAFTAPLSSNGAVDRDEHVDDPELTDEEADYAAHIEQRNAQPEPFDFEPKPRRPHYLHAQRRFPTRAGVGAEQMSPDPVDVDDDEAVETAADLIESSVDTEVAPDTDADELPSYLRSSAGPLFGGQTVADDLARRRTSRYDDLDVEDEEAEEAESTMSSFVHGAWIVGQCIIAVAFGAGLFIAFDQLWKWNNIVALVLSVLVILGLVVGVRVVRKTEDIGSTLIAVAVGALVTLGPLALLQSG